MNYATIDDLMLRFGEAEVIQLSDRNLTGSVDAAVLDIALADATAEINSYLGRYPLPFDTVPPILNRLCCDIVRYRLAGTSGALSTEEIQCRYKIDVLNLLKGLANGDVTLGVKEDGKEVESSDLVVSFTNKKNRVFSRDH